MNRQLAQLQDSDPAFARTLKRLRLASYGLAAAIILAAGLGLWAVVVNSEQATQITKIQKTPCTLDPEGNACTTIKERIARHGSLKNPCIEHQRVTGTKGRNCPQFYVSPSQREVQISSKEVQNLELDAEGPAPKVASGVPGGVKPPESGSAKPPAPTKPGNKGEGTPVESPQARPEPPVEPPPSAPAATSEPAKPGTSSASEASPGLIGNPGGAVGKAACDASEAVNELAGVRVCE